MVSVVKATVNRKTGEVMNEQVLEQVEMTNDEYYGPLTEVLGSRFLQQWQTIDRKMKPCGRGDGFGGTQVSNG